MTFLQLLNAARRDGYHVEQIELRRAVFARKVTSTYTSRIVAKLGANGWEAHFPRQRFHAPIMSVRDARHYFGETDPYRAYHLANGGRF